MPDARWLVLMDVDRIQQYIFMTNRLREIRGASFLLDRLNLQTCRQELANYGGQEVFIGGGGVLAIFPDRERAAGYLAAVQAAYRRQTHIASITDVMVPIPTAAGGEREVLRRARAELRLAKGRRAGTEALLTNPYFRLCQSCNRYPVAHLDDGDEICAACHAKRQEADSALASPHSGYARFARRASLLYGDDRWQGLRRVPAKLDHLEGPDTSHIGFIHADANGLGAFLEGQNTLDDIKALGRAVEDALESALVDAVHQVGLEPRGRQWPFLIIAMGGDDITLIVPARCAIPLANGLCLAFEDRIKGALGEARNARGEATGKLALSAGVVIAKPAHPAYALAERAADLTRSAKRRSRELEAREYGPIPTLDFLAVYAPSADPIQAMRREEYFERRNGQEYWHTFRPLPCRPVGPWPGMDVLLEVIRELRRSDFPRNKLNEWADLIHAGDMEQILGWQMLQTRVGGEAHQALITAIQKLGLTRERIFCGSGGRKHPEANRAPPPPDDAGPRDALAGPAGRSESRTGHREAGRA